MLYTTYKKGIELLDERFKNLNDSTEEGGYDAKPYIKDLLKFQAIKSNEEEIEYHKEEIEHIQKHSKGNYADGMVESHLDSISHLQTQNKLIEDLIEEDKNI